MSSSEQVEILLLGTEAWNQWRSAHSKIRPQLQEVQVEWLDLSGADLHDADLSGADFSESNLRGANLHRACLTGAYLREAALSEANLAGSDLRATELRDANLRGAILTDARLDDASMTEINLHSADLRRAHLPGADLTRGNLSATAFSCANLTGANLRCESLENADFTDANLRNVVLEKDHNGPFAAATLELLQATGIECARFTSRERLAMYAEHAVRFAHHSYHRKGDWSITIEGLRAVRVLEELYTAPGPIPKVLQHLVDDRQRTQTSELHCGRLLYCYSLVGPGTSHLYATWASDGSSSEVVRYDGR